MLGIRFGNDRNLGDESRCKDRVGDLVRVDDAVVLSVHSVVSFDFAMALKPTWTTCLSRGRSSPPHDYMRRSTFSRTPNRLVVNALKGPRLIALIQSASSAVSGQKRRING